MDYKPFFYVNLIFPIETPQGRHRPSALLRRGIPRRASPRGADGGACADVGARGAGGGDDGGWESDGGSYGGT
jgi:hypothetical protein